ncbi:MAG: hypothetical protein Q8L66_12675 [Caulobacter sp.]|nr:hypothetical protein [Caulobacter sp.]
MAGATAAFADGKGAAPDTGDAPRVAGAADVGGAIVARDVAAGGVDGCSSDASGAVGGAEEAATAGGAVVGAVAAAGGDAGGVMALVWAGVVGMVDAGEAATAGGAVVGGDAGGVTALVWAGVVGMAGATPEPIVDTAGGTAASALPCGGVGPAVGDTVSATLGMAGVAGVVDAIEDDGGADATGARATS